MPRSSQGSGKMIKERFREDVEERMVSPESLHDKRADTQDQ
jgi:hypothetical protein